MRAFIEASLVSTLSLVITLLILAVIIPRHPLGGGIALETPALSPAVFVEGTNERPGRIADKLHPRTPQPLPTDLCPYLAALAAASACPALPEKPSESSCPDARELKTQEIDAHNESAKIPGKKI